MKKKKGEREPSQVVATNYPPLFGETWNVQLGYYLKRFNFDNNPTRVKTPGNAIRDLPAFSVARRKLTLQTAPSLFHYPFLIPFFLPFFLSFYSSFFKINNTASLWLEFQVFKILFENCEFENSKEQKVFNILYLWKKKN